MPADFRELGPSYRAANPAGVIEALAGTGAQGGDQQPVPAKKPPTRLPKRRLQRPQVPTLLITGDADLYSPPALIRMVSAHITNSVVAIMREAGHSSYWEQPEAFNRAVLDFLARHSK